MLIPAGQDLPARLWTQVYDPHGLPWWLSALVASLPLLVLFWMLGVRRAPAPRSALCGAATALLVAILFSGMPPTMALAAFGYGAAFGILPIGWVVFAALLLYQVTVDTGQFDVMRESIGRLSGDRRIQAIIVAFSFNAILEGAAGFGVPVAISAALLVGLGFRPLTAAVLCLIGNTVPVVWASVGIPLVALATSSGLPLADLSATSARILPLVSAILPLWIVRTMVPWRETLEVLPAALTAGISCAVTQFLWGNHVDASLVGLIPGLVSLVSLAGLLLVWKPRRTWGFPGETESKDEAPASRLLGKVRILRAWTPFLLLFILVVAWGILKAKTSIDSWGWGWLRTNWAISVPGLDGRVMRTPPVVAVARTEEAIYSLSWLSSMGTGIFLAALLSALVLGQGPRDLGRSLLATGRRMRSPILAIMPMVGLGFVIRYSGLDAILGRAFTHTGAFYPLFGTFLGWIGVVITGSDTASNILFGNLQRITAEQLRLDPILMCAANSAGGAVGKMINTQSIVVAAAATDQAGSEGKILRAVLWHAIAMGILMAFLILAAAWIAPWMVAHGVKLLG